MAVRYSSVVFAGAPVMWVFNALLALVRGQGSIRLAKTMVCGGAVLMLPLRDSWWPRPSVLPPRCCLASGSASSRGGTEAVAVGTKYLTTVGPFYGFVGAAFVLYCAAQGTGRMMLPVAGAFARTIVAATGGALAVHLGGTFLAAGIGMIVFAAFGLTGLVLSVGYAASAKR